MKNPAPRVTGLITHNFGWKVLSLLIALAIWIAVSSEPELSTFATARVEFKNLPQDLELSSEPVTSVLLELRGPSGELSRLGDSSRHPAVVLDMGGVGPGEHTFPIGLKNVNVPRGIRIVRATPSEVRLDLSRSFTRAVPVNVRFTGEGRNGYHVTALCVDPKELEIVGPHQRVAGINSVNTDPINVSSATGYMKVLLNAYVQDPFVRFESSPQVTVTFTMRK